MTGTSVEYMPVKAVRGTCREQSSIQAERGQILEMIHRGQDRFGTTPHICRLSPTPLSINTRAILARPIPFLSFFLDRIGLEFK